MKHILITILILLVAGPYVSAQQDLIDKYLSPTSTTTPSTPEEVAELNRQIKEALGLPPDAAPTFYELLKRGSSKGGTGDGQSVLDTLKKAQRDIRLEFGTDEFAPGKKIRARVETFQVDTKTARIVWVHNGRTVLSGPGENTYDFTLRDIGTSEDIVVIVNDGSNDPPSVARTIYPALIHLQWFTDSYTPGWYKGKALFTPKSEVFITAIPEFQIFSSRFDPSDLIYNWKINGTNTVKSKSGTGKNTMSFSLSSVSKTSYDISVEVKDSRDRIITTESTQISPQKPIMGFYERESLFGLKTWQNLDETVIKAGENIVIRLEPFFIPIRNFADIRYQWKINGNRVEGASSISRSLLLTTSPTSSGRQTIQIDYSNPLNIFERGSRQTNVIVE
jgi:hypothetical protein